MALVIAHNDDKKEKWQSHEIYMINMIKDSNGRIDKYSYDNGLSFSDIRGYGESQEEAFDNFKKEFLKNFEELEKIKTKLLNNEDITTYEVDYAGNILNEEEN